MRNRTARRARPASLSHRTVGPLPWSYFVVIAICGCVIAAGFLLAARQHFVSMDLGMKNSSLRKQLEGLESENRRLLLAREVALSPIEITKTARSFGFVDLGVGVVPVPASAPAAKPADRPTLINAVATETKSSVVAKTAYQRPSQPESKPAAAKPTASAKPVKKTEKVRPESSAIAKR